MIIDFEVNFNDYEENIFNFYGFWKYSCPCCGAKNSFIRHATYSRYICTLNIDNLEFHKFNVLRLYCKSCKTTHAILPAGTIPYCFYSFACVLIVLMLYFIEENSALTIADNLNISYEMIYIFISKYLLQMVSCINFLRMYLMTDLEYNVPYRHPLYIIQNNFTYISFQYQYLLYTKRIFLMTRKLSFSMKKSQTIITRTIWIGT